MIETRSTHPGSGEAGAAVPDASGARVQTDAGDVKVITATTAEAIQRLRPDWESVLRRAGAITPYNDPDRFAAEIRAAAGQSEPYVVVFHVAGEPQGLLLGRTECSRLHYRIGYWTVCTPKIRILQVVHGGLVAGQGAVSPDVVTGYLRSLLSEGRIDLINFNHLPLAHEMYDVLVGAKADPSPPAPHWRRKIVADATGAVVGAFASKHRSELRRTDRILRDHFQQQVELRLFRQTHELEELLAGTTAMSAKTYQAQLGAGFSGEGVWRDILATEARLRRLRCYWLICQGTPIAFQIGAVYGNTYYGYFTGYLPEHAALSPGTVLHMRVLQDLHAAGAEVFDYGFGDAGYKKGYGAESQDETTLKIYGSSRRAWCASAIESVGDLTMKAAAWCVDALGLRDRLKKHWRSRLARDK